MKKAEAAAANGNKAEAQTLARQAESMMAKAVKKGLFHKATMARKVGRVQVRANKASAK
jgi:small subunit ribosomal protein S20